VLAERLLVNWKVCQQSCSADETLENVTSHPSGEVWPPPMLLLSHFIQMKCAEPECHQRFAAAPELVVCVHNEDNCIVSCCLRSDECAVVNKAIEVMWQKVEHLCNACIQAQHL
jgi:hypothetical protein